VDTRRRLVTVLTAAAAASFALSVVAAPANASPAASLTTVTTVAAPHTMGTPGTAVVEVVRSTTTTIAVTAASGCNHNVQTDTLNQAPFNWPELAWFTMDTYWCWNGTKVTYHSTTQHGAATGSGNAVGWSYSGTVSGTVGWSCYVAVGSKVNCSGNEEHAQGNFDECALKVGCISKWQPYIQEWENYHGGKGRWH
jgi:hypothetical protein